jgi:hypothetical protein
VAQTIEKLLEDYQLAVDELNIEIETDIDRHKITRGKHELSQEEVLTDFINNGSKRLRLFSQ